MKAEFADTAEKPVEKADPNIFEQIYQEMRQSGKTRAMDSPPEYTRKDPYWALHTLVAWFDTVAADKATDYRHAWCYSTFKPIAPTQQFRWDECTDMKNLHAAANLDLSAIRDVFEAHVKRHPIAFPAPLSTSVLISAVRAGQAIRPYLDQSKALAEPQHYDHMLKIMVEIAGMIEFIGSSTGLSKKSIDAVKNEIIAPTITIPEITAKDEAAAAPRTAAPRFKEKTEALIEIRWRR